MTRNVAICHNSYENHGVGCACDLCDDRGVSYSMALYEVPNGVYFAFEDELEDYISEQCEIHKVTYAPTYEAARLAAYEFCKENNLNVII